MVPLCWMEFAATGAPVAAALLVGELDPLAAADWWMPKAAAAALALSAALALADASTEKVPAAWLTNEAALPAWLRPSASPNAPADPKPRGVPAPVRSYTSAAVVALVISNAA